VKLRDRVELFSFSPLLVIATFLVKAVVFVAELDLPCCTGGRAGDVLTAGFNIFDFVAEFTEANWGSLEYVVVRYPTPNKKAKAPTLEVSQPSDWQIHSRSSQPFWRNYELSWLDPPLIRKVEVIRQSPPWKPVPVNLTSAFLDRCCTRIKPRQLKGQISDLLISYDRQVGHDSGLGNEGSLDTDKCLSRSFIRITGSPGSDLLRLALSS
jgi:hypothetical protein